MRAPERAVRLPRPIASRSPEDDAAGATRSFQDGPAGSPPRAVQRVPAGGKRHLGARAWPAGGAPASSRTHHHGVVVGLTGRLTALAVPGGTIRSTGLPAVRFG